MARWKKNALQTGAEVNRVKREAVLRVGSRIFSQRGYHNTSLDDVAKALDVSKGTLYNYVKDKQEILFEYHQMAMDIAEQALSFGTSNGKTAAEKLRLAFSTYILRLNEELGGFGVIAEVRALKPADRKAIVARRDAVDAAFVRILQGGVADKSLRKLDPKMAIFTFAGALQLIPVWYSPKGRLAASEIAASITDILMNGLSAR